MVVARWDEEPSLWEACGQRGTSQSQLGREAVEAPRLDNEVLTGRESKIFSEALLPVSGGSPSVL